jgi:hypothetical protein
MEFSASVAAIAGTLEDVSINAAFWPVSHDLKRLANLVRREGIASAWRKGVRYLRWRIPAELRRFRMLRLSRPEDRFTMIWRTNMWAARESVSGPASSMVNTEALRRELPRLFRRLGVEAIFDAPCGDFYWMQHVVRASSIRYIGGDIVRPLISQNETAFGTGRCRFVHIDVTTDEVPRTDLWICRGLLSLLSNEDSLAVLRQFVRSGTPHILLSTHRNPENLPNLDVVSGDFRYVDLLAAPFHLPAPILRLEDRPDEEICLWSRQQVATAIGFELTPHGLAGRVDV